MTKARDIANAGTALSSVDATELGYLDGVTSNIQTQFSNISGSKAQPTEPSSPTDGMIWVDTDGSTTDANFIPKTLTSTTGDIIYASSANTPARLGIGSTSQVLTVSGGVPTWATPAASTSGLTLVKQQTIGSSVTSVTVTGAFSSTYDNYRILISGGSGANTGSITMQLGSTNTGYYLTGFYQSFGTSPTLNAYGFLNGSSFNVGYMAANGIGSMIDINNPNLADETVFGVRQITLATNGTLAQYQGYLNNTTSYTAFTLTFEYAQTGGEIRVYGYQNS